MTSTATALISAIAAIVVSPLLAGWTIGLTTDRTVSNRPWWRPRKVNARQLITVALVAAVLAIGATRGVPVVAWWMFAAGGAVLCVTDAQHHLLPARLVYPLAAVILTAITISALLAGEPDRLLRAVLAATAVGAAWFTVAFLTPPAMGLGDVRVAALTAMLLGWNGWTEVLAGQLLTLVFAVITAGILALSNTQGGRATQVPMGPALILGAIAATWL